MTIKYYTLWFFNYNHTVINIYGKWMNKALLGSQGPPWQPGCVTGQPPS